jgi:hypothetical protein
MYNQNHTSSKPAQAVTFGNLEIDSKILPPPDPLVFDSDWLKKKYPVRFIPDTTWIWQLDEMVEVKVVEGYRKVLRKRDENGKPVYGNESYTTQIIPPNAKRWNENGERIYKSIGIPLEERTADISNLVSSTNIGKQLQLFF